MKIDKPPVCPHCGKVTEQYEPPPFNFGDGMGWGTPFLYVCFNNDCPLFVRGWEHMLNNYGRVASYRYMVLPDTGLAELMAVFNPMMDARRKPALDPDDTADAD